MRRPLRLFLALAAALFASALPATAATTRYQNTFDDASSLAGCESSAGAEGGSVTVEDGRLVLRGAPFSYRGARVAVPLSLVFGRPGPFTAAELARARISWSFNIGYENGADGATNTGFRVYPLSTSASPDAEAAAFYSLRGGIYPDDRVVFQQMIAASADAIPWEPSADGALSLPPAPVLGAVRMDLDFFFTPRWTLRLHRGESVQDPEKLPYLATQVRSHTEYAANPNAFTHLVLEGQNGGAVWIDNLVVTTYDSTAEDTRGPDQIISKPAWIDAPHAFGDEPIPLPALSSAGLPITWQASGAGRVESGSLHLTGAGTIYLHGYQPGDAVYRATSSQFYLAVAPRALSIQLSGLRQTYAAAPHPIIATASPAEAPLRITYHGSETPPRHAGAYDIEVASTSPDYAGGASGTLIVGRAPLTVRPAPVTRLVGQPNPNPYPLAYSGFLGDDGPASIDKTPLARAEAAVSSRPGDYPVSLSGGSDNDYELHNRPGLLTVLSYAGVYEAILTPPDQPGAPPLGKLSVTLSTTRPAFSGTLWLAGENFARPFTGTLGELRPDGGAPALFFLARPPGVPAQHLLKLDLDASRLRASLTRGVDIPSLVLFATSEEGARRHVSPPGAASPWKGRHTLLLRPESPAPSAAPDSAPAPRGPGHAVGDIAAASGKLTLSGRLPDGTTLTASSFPDEAGRHRLFLRPHGALRPNALVGRLDLLPHPVLADRHYIPAGQQTLFWSRAPIPAPKADALYPAGYASLPLSVLLDPWLPPSPAKRATAQTPAQPAVTLVHRLGLAENSPALELLYSESSDFGPASAFLPAEIALAPSGKPIAPSPNPARWSVAFDAARGTLSGSFVLRYPPIPPAAKETTKTLSFSGVLRQPATADDPLVGAARFLWTDTLHGRPRASDELLLLRPVPEPESQSEPALASESAPESATAPQPAP